MEATKQARKINPSILITFPLILSACGGSETSSDDSSSQESSAELTASDIDVSVSCGPWRETFLGGETDCNIEVTNMSAASGYVHVFWDFKVGDKFCGFGKYRNSDGLPRFISVDAYGSGTASQGEAILLCSAWDNPRPVNVGVTVKQRI